LAAAGLGFALTVGFLTTFFSDFFAGVFRE
jgi:hypothetical protein